MKNHLDKRNIMLNRKLMESWGYKKEELTNENEAEMPLETPADVAKYLEEKYLEQTEEENLFWREVKYAHPDKARLLVIEKYPVLENVKGFEQGIENWSNFASLRGKGRTIDNYLDSLEDQLTDDDDWYDEQDERY